MTKMLHGLITAGLLVITSAAQAQSISAGVTVNNFGTPTNWTFSFFSPIASALTGQTSYSWTSAITLTDGGTDGVLATRNTLPEFWRVEVFNGSTYTLVDDFGGVGPLNAVGTVNDNTTGMFNCSSVGSCTGLRLTLSFIQGGGIQDQFNGQANFAFEPTVVPEPGSLALLGTGLVGLGVYRRRRV